MTLTRSTLADQAYEELKDRIVSGRLPAGQRLLAEELADALAISQTPVKEALVRLERDGLVEGASRRASTVRRFTLADIREIYEARQLLELHSLASGIRHGGITAAFVSDLKKLFAEQMRAIERQTEEGLAEAIRLDRAFHERLVSLGDNQLIANWHRMILRQTQAIRNYSLRHYSGERTEREHGAIVRALVEKRYSDAIEALKSHLQASRDEFLSRPSEELPTPP